MPPLVVIAPDKFKGSLNAREAAEAIARGLQRGGLGADRAELRLLPIADGGEGTAAAVHHACGGEWVVCRVSDPLGRPADAAYALVQQDGLRVAVLEMSQAAGLWRLSPGELGRADASTRGVGEMMLHAAGRGAERILLGLGGSATNDGGTGMAQALGWRFLDAGGCPVTDLPRKLPAVREVDPEGRQALPPVVAMCDVDNPLLGPRGCTRVFGPQKGFLRPGEHEPGLQALAEAVRRARGKDFAGVPGSGAAGGMGFGCLAFAGASLESGFGRIAALLGLEQAIHSARLVITGEGSLDRQTLNGKGPHGVARLARKWGRPVLALCGIWDGSPEVEREFDRICALADGGRPVAECIARAGELLEGAATEASGWAIRQIEG